MESTVFFQMLFLPTVYSNPRIKVIYYAHRSRRTISWPNITPQMILQFFASALGGLMSFIFCEKQTHYPNRTVLVFVDNGLFSGCLQGIGHKNLLEPHLECTHITLLRKTHPAISCLHLGYLSRCLIPVCPTTL